MSMGILGESFDIQIGRGVNRSLEQETWHDHFVCTEADGINADAFLGGKFGCLNRVDFADIVHTIGQQYQYPAFGGSFLQSFDGQSNSVADGGLASGNPKWRFC